MNERIEEDRRLLRAGKRKATRGALSYIASLAEGKPKCKTWLKVHSLSTINILNYIDESYRLGDRYVLQRLKEVRAVLLERGDLFDAALLFLTKAVVRSELYYWHPGLETSSIFSFISELIPDFVARYKGYYARCMITKTTPLDCAGFIKERFRDALDHILIMQEDLQLFEHCITLPYWPDTTEMALSERGHILLPVPKRIEVADDIEAFLVPELSFVDCTIGDKQMTVPLSQLDGLLNQSEEVKEFWMKVGIVDKNWLFLV